MSQKPILAIICGGQSPEHPISLISATNIATMATANFAPILVTIDRNGSWYIADAQAPFLNPGDPLHICLNQAQATPVYIRKDGEKTILCDFQGHTICPDIYFPIIHGENGEDGSIQGLLQLMDVPYVGCGIAASANGIDKDLTKRLLQAAGIQVAPWICITPETQINPDEIIQTLSLPIFVKPARLGSSVGIIKVTQREELIPAIKEALCYDTKVLLETTIVGREIECAVMGNRHPVSSLPGEIIPQTDYYSFDTKYVDSDGALLKCPAELTDDEIARFRAQACRVYSVLECSGMTRVDFFYTADKSIILNEVNTHPGFTNISMFPKLWEKTGIPQQDLIVKLTQFALERYREQKSMRRA